MLIRLIAVIISQCISQHHVAYLKYKQSLFANHTSIRLVLSGEEAQGSWNSHKGHGDGLVLVFLWNLKNII